MHDRIRRLAGPLAALILAGTLLGSQPASAAQTGRHVNDFTAAAVFHRTAAQVYIEYDHDRQWAIAGTGLDKPVALSNTATRQVYEVFANGENEWYFEERGDTARCLARVTLFVKTERCANWPRGKLFVPVAEDKGGYWKFRQPGGINMMSFREPPAQGRQILLLVNGKKGAGQAWYLNVLNKHQAKGEHHDPQRQGR